jgi:imidazolonepropionase-like amidohydrolase
MNAYLPGPTYAITSVSVIDVANGETVPGQTVIVSGGRIERIDAQERVILPEQAQKIDGHGLFLMPGLVDAHVHYFDAPIFGRLMIANGVLLVRDMGMPNEAILPLRDALNMGEMLGPEMVTSGAMLDGEPAIIPPISLAARTPEEGRAAVAHQARAGVDFIKAYSRLDRQTFLAILEEARKYHLKVAAHLPESIYLVDAAAAGLSSSEHFNGFEKVLGQLLGEPVRFHYVGQAADAGYLARLDEVDPTDLQRVYRRLHASGITICPTIVTFKTLTHVRSILSDPVPGSEYVSPGIRELWKTLWRQQDDLPCFIWRNWARMVADLNRAGVPLMVGTDLLLPGILPGCSVHKEMAIWQGAGIPTADVLRSATIVPARFMGLEDRLGTIDEGKNASMVLVRANPLEDIHNTQQIEGVFFHGIYYNRPDLDRLLDEAKDLARQPESQQTPTD